MSLKIWISGEATETVIDGALACKTPGAYAHETAKMVYVVVVTESGGLLCLKRERNPDEKAPAALWNEFHLHFRPPSRSDEYRVLRHFWMVVGADKPDFIMLEPNFHGKNPPEPIDEKKFTDPGPPSLDDYRESR